MQDRRKLIMNNAFVDEFKELLFGVTEQIIGIFDLLWGGMPELATTAYRNLGKALTNHISNAQRLPEPSSDGLKKIKHNYIDYLRAQLRSCQLCQNQEDNPTDINLKLWEDSFIEMRELQEEFRQLLLNDEAFQAYLKNNS